ncbi:MAG: 23S rRNA (guanosine(2251)-2'-O)-methyltransferase RlmB [Emergencia sp.]
MIEKRTEPAQDAIAGRNAVREALRSDRPIESILVARGARNGSLGDIVAKAKAQGIAVKESDPKKLDFLCSGANHQGIVALAAAHEYASVEDMLALAEQRGEPPFLIVADELNDPHNLGAILRTAECAGAHGVIIPKRRSAGLTYTVGKASAGALEYVPVARVSNLAATLEDLKKRGLWIYGADMEGTPWCQADLKGPAALVIGSEGVGIGRLVKEKCDLILSLPMQGKINSLNASVAAGVLMYEFTRQRLEIKAK